MEDGHGVEKAAAMAAVDRVLAGNELVEKEREHQEREHQEREHQEREHQEPVPVVGAVEAVRLAAAQVQKGNRFVVSTRSPPANQVLATSSIMEEEERRTRWRFVLVF